MGSKEQAQLIYCSNSRNLLKRISNIEPFPPFLLVLMLEPAIEGKATDHALFCKYAGELLERVTGKTLAKSTVVPSLSRITKVLSIFSYLLRQETFIRYRSWTSPFISLFLSLIHI